MGAALCRRLLEVGVDLSVYNRTRDKVLGLGDLGATIVDSPAKLSDRDLVVTMVADDDQDRRAVGVLLHARAKTHLRLGRRAQARRDFEAALVAFGATPDPLGEPLRTATHLALVFMLVESDPDAALEHMVRAVACDEAPELAQDRLRHEPPVAARAAADPTWARVLTEAPAPAGCLGPSAR